MTEIQHDEISQDDSRDEDKFVPVIRNHPSEDDLEESEDLEHNPPNELSRLRDIKLSEKEISRIDARLLITDPRVDYCGRFCVGFKSVFENYKYIFKHHLYRTFFFEWSRGLCLMVLVFLFATFNRSMVDTAVSVFYAGTKDDEKPHQKNVIFGIIFYSLSGIMSIGILGEVLGVILFNSMRISAYQRVVFYTEELIRGSNVYVDWRVANCDCTKQSCRFIGAINRTCCFIECPIYLILTILFFFLPPVQIFVRMFFYGFNGFKMLFIVRGEYWRTWRFCFKKENLPIILGIAVAACIIDLIPFCNLFTSLATTVAAVRLFHHLEHHHKNAYGEDFLED